MLNDLVRTTHLHFDEFTRVWLGLLNGKTATIHCGKGCSGCCSLAVHTSFPEAATVGATLTIPQQQRLSGYIERLIAKQPELTDMKSYLRRHREEIGPCPFLDNEGSCGVYAVRPLTCRALLSTRPAEWCSVDFTALDEWDRQAYEAGLNRQIVAWPTHYVAATQEMARQRESDLLVSMQQKCGWSLAGNFPLLAWLAHPERLGRSGITVQQADDLLGVFKINHLPLLALKTTTGADPVCR